MHIANVQPNSAAATGCVNSSTYVRQEADRADEVQRLVDAAVVIEAVVVPALLFQFLEKAFHELSSRCALTSQTERLAQLAANRALWKANFG